MATAINREMLLTQVRSMISQLTERLGDENPWAAHDLEKLSEAELAAVKRMVHELLYAPPPRGNR